MSPLHAQYIVVSSSHRPRHLDGGSSASLGREKRGPSGPRPRPPPISPRDVNRPARLAVDGLGVSEPDSDDPAGAVPTSNAPPSPPDSYSTTTVEPSASSRVERYLRSLGGSSSSSAGSSSSQPQKKWVPEQGHWETDYGQVWIPNVVYVRHERYWVNHGGTKVGPFDSKAAAWAWCDNDVDNGGIGGSVIDDSYTTSEDQGRYEQQATGRHWVVDVAGPLGVVAAFGRYRTVAAIHIA